MRAPRRLARTFALTAAFASGPSGAAAGNLEIRPSAFRVVERESGSVNYYTLGEERGVHFVRARYRPPLETVVLGWQAPDSVRKSARRLRWEWRVRRLPAGGNDCVDGKGDSAAGVYVMWKRGFKYYSLKYVWSGAGETGGCKRKRSPFVAEDAVVVRAGPPLDVWHTVDIDLRREFQRHFSGGDTSASVPDFVGVGLLTDGDQTKSESSADYGSFTLSH